MMHFDRFQRFKGYGALDADQIARLDAVVAKAKADADAASALTPNLAQRAWASLIGASSTTAAMQTDAAASQTLYNVLKAKRDRLATDPNANEYDVEVMEGSTVALGNDALQAASDQLSLTAFNQQVVQPTVAQAADAVSSPFGLPWWAWIAGAGALYLIARGTAAGYSRRK